MSQPSVISVRASVIVHPRALASAFSVFSRLYSVLRQRFPALNPLEHVPGMSSRPAAGSAIRDSPAGTKRQGSRDRGSGRGWQGRRREECDGLGSAGDNGSQDIGPEVRERVLRVREREEAAEREEKEREGIMG